MKKLTLEHLAGYLPYKLRAICHTNYESGSESVIELIKHHFDIHNLIKYNLAIDINTL